MSRPVADIGPDMVVVEWAELDLLVEDPAALVPADLARRDRMIPSVGQVWAKGRAFVRRRLGQHLGLDPTLVSLRADDHGRPFLGSGPAGSGMPELSISHSRSVIALALGPGRIGVDVEDLPGPGDLLGIAATVATPAELASLTDLAGRDPAALPASFQRWWVRKEAVLKAQGSGFLRDPSTVHVGADHRQADPPAPWVVHDLGLLPIARARITAAPALALACDDTRFEVHVRQF